MRYGGVRALPALGDGRPSAKGSGGDQARAGMVAASREIKMRILVAAGLSVSLGGCVAKTALDLVTLPVKVASKGVDVLTTSQAEADQKRGRAIRKHEECLGKEARPAERGKRSPDYGRCDEDGGARR